MRFEAFDAEIYPGPDVCKPEVPTIARARTCVRRHSVHRGWPGWNLTTTVQHRNEKCSTTRAQNGRYWPGGGNDSNGKSWQSALSGYPNIFDHARLRYDTADMVRHRELKMSAMKPEVEIAQVLFPLPVFVAVILGSGCRPLSDNVELASLSWV